MAAARATAAGGARGTDGALPAIRSSGGGGAVFWGSQAGHGGADESVGAQSGPRDAARDQARDNFLLAASRVLSSGGSQAPAPSRAHAAGGSALGDRLSSTAGGRRRGVTKSDAQLSGPEKAAAARRATGATEAATSTFYNVLRTLISAVRVELVKGWDEPSLFVAPREGAADKFYPDTVQLEHPAYFEGLRRKREADDRRRAVGGAAASSSVASLQSDKQLRYVFDRTPELGMVQKRQRCEHALAILQEEVAKEVQRQSSLAACPAGRLGRLRWQVARERAEAGDWIMRILQDYRLVSATVMVDYLRESLTEDEALGMAELRAIRDGRRVGRDARGRSKDLLDLVSDDLMKEDEETRATRKEAARWEQRARRGRQRGKAEVGTFDAIAAESELAALTRAQEAAHEREERAAKAHRRGDTAAASGGGARGAGGGSARGGRRPRQGREGGARAGDSASRRGRGARVAAGRAPAAPEAATVLERAAAAMRGEGRGLTAEAEGALPSMAASLDDAGGSRARLPSDGMGSMAASQGPVAVGGGPPGAVGLPGGLATASVASTLDDSLVRSAVVLPSAFSVAGRAGMAGRADGFAAAAAGASPGGGLTQAPRGRAAPRSSIASAATRSTAPMSVVVADETRGGDLSGAGVARPHITPGSLAAMAGLTDIESPLLPELDRVAEARKARAEARRKAAAAVASPAAAVAGASAVRRHSRRASTTATGGHTAAGDDGGDGDGDEEGDDDDDDDGGGPLRVSIVEKMRLRRNPDGTMVQPEMRWTRTDVEAAIEATHDTVNVKDTVGLMLKLLKQQPREPPNGRYSHLIGRWMQFES
ncbi:hypothetical protein FNF29_07057 [Cafeteria roenbergensis]|uniref:Uncharacterized protein n=1 Tax=Cafeteria roenbergensis TaxID=33653 RepID=A0A5A8C4A1_CAFRO|nr:hypothetical protein FNF29_07057 [Cafeteria roenbergensis]|eukprot:KAA0147843.1 hypothetical protein FNF29_07057 [Cafeteria roenbergensis]